MHLRTDQEDVVEWNEQFSLARTEYGAVVLDRSAGEYFQLTRSATLVVDKLLADGSVDDAVRALQDRFEVDRETAQRDVTELVGLLRTRGMVQ
jgi:DeoR/GlpR family transcriptional regulator of sugar metabolism